MKKINLKKFYYFVHDDLMIDVDDAVANVFDEDRKNEHNYQEKRRYWKAYYSLDRTPTLANYSVKKEKSTEELLAEDYVYAVIMRAIEQLTPSQKRRVISYYFYGMKISQIAKEEHVDKRAVSDSLKQAEKKLKKVLKDTPLFDAFSAVE